MKGSSDWHAMTHLDEAVEEKGVEEGKGIRRRGGVYYRSWNVVSADRARKGKKVTELKKAVGAGKRKVSGVGERWARGDG